MYDVYGVLRAISKCSVLHSIYPYSVLGTKYTVHSILRTGGSWLSFYRVPRRPTPQSTLRFTMVTCLVTCDKTGRPSDQSKMHAAFSSPASYPRPDGFEVSLLQAVVAPLRAKTFSAISPQDTKLLYLILLTPTGLYSPWHHAAHTKAYYYFGREKGSFCSFGSKTDSSNCSNKPRNCA